MCLISTVESGDSQLRNRLSSAEIDRTVRAHLVVMRTKQQILDSATHAKFGHVPFLIRPAPNMSVNNIGLSNTFPLTTSAKNKCELISASSQVK